MANAPSGGSSESGSDLFDQWMAHRNPTPQVDDDAAVDSADEPEEEPEAPADAPVVETSPVAAPVAPAAEPTPEPTLEPTPEPTPDMSPDVATAPEPKPSWQDQELTFDAPPSVAGLEPPPPAFLDPTPPSPPATTPPPVAPPTFHGSHADAGRAVLDALTSSYVAPAAAATPESPTERPASPPPAAGSRRARTKPAKEPKRAKAPKASKASKSESDPQPTPAVRERRRKPAPATPPVAPPVGSTRTAPGETPTHAKTAETRAEAAAEAAAAAATSRRSTDPVPALVEFTPRTGVRRLVGLLLLVALAAAGVAGFFAQQDPNQVSIGIAATLGAVAAIIWAVRASSAVTVLTVHHGQLEIMRGGSRHRFDLASQYSAVEVVGKPGDSKWKVLFHRRSMSPFVIDSSMVDPTEFMRVLRYYRPGA